jgi:hypothetical protein
LGASSYEIWRRTNGDYTLVADHETGLGYLDTTATATTAYLYRVRAVDPGGTRGTFSSPDLATTMLFTDPTSAAGTTKVKVAHISELRTAINAVRATAGLSATTFTDANLGGIKIKGIHVSELRSSLDAARSALSLSTVTYSDSPISAQTTKVKAAHVAELRSGVR